jgi:predicted lipoprotein with Yx(FWY)xxD motif
MRRRMLGFVVVLGLAAWTLSAVTPAGAAVTKPGAPGRPTAASGDKSARVSWSAPSNGGSKITIYLVTPYLGTKAQTTVSFHSSKTTEVVGGLKNGKSYTFKVAAHNAVGTGKQSAASKPVTIGVPSAPSRLAVAPGNAQATVTWKAPSSPGSAISSYIVTPYLGSVAQAPRTFSSAATTAVVTGLTNTKSYSFRVAARNAAGIGPQSALEGPVKLTSNAALTVMTVKNTLTNMNQSVIVDAYGHPLYLFTPDGSGTVSKAGSELGLWPAVTWSGTPTVAGGLDQTKAAVYAQADGTQQLSYNGHLLYTFLYDPGGSVATGDGDVGFYLLSSSGDQS